MDNPYKDWQIETVKKFGSDDDRRILLERLENDRLPQIEFSDFILRILCLENCEAPEKCPNCAKEENFIWRWDHAEDATMTFEQWEKFKNAQNVIKAKNTNDFGVTLEDSLHMDRLECSCGFEAHHLYLEVSVRNKNVNWYCSYLLYWQL